jgi:predicted ATP-dependent protease
MYWPRLIFGATKAGRAVIARADIASAIEKRIRRSSRLRDRAQEEILQDIALVDTSGTSVGQVNGLSVAELAGFRFGRPTRITSRVRPGSGKVVDIEREVALGMSSRRCSQNGRRSPRVARARGKNGRSGRGFCYRISGS